MIKQLYQTDKNLAIRLINEEEIKPEETQELYELLNEKDDELLFAIYSYFNKNPQHLDLKKFSQITKIPVFVLHKIFTEKPIKVKFPVVNNKEADIASAYIFIFNKEIPQNTFFNKEELKIIKRFLKQRNINRNFFVIFDKQFKGKSYLLAVVAGLILPEYILEDFAFTGEVNEEGEIYPVGYIKNKKKIADKNNLNLITYEDIYHIDELIYYLGEEAIDIPFVQLSNKTEEEAYISLEKLENKIKEKINFYSLEKLEKFFGISKKDLILTSEYLPKPEKDNNQWINTIKTFEEKLKKIYSSIKRKKRILHFSGSISSLAFGFGIKLGTKKPVIVYHYQADNYHKVIDLSNEEQIRQIKHIKEKLENLEIKQLKGNKNAKELAIAIWIAGHNPYGDVLRFSENKNWEVIGIEAKKFKGNLPLPKKREYENLWLEITREIFTVINDMKNKKYERIHIFLSSPVAISFASGMAIGHFINGTVYNINKNDETPYFATFNIEDKALYSMF